MAETEKKKRGRPGLTQEDRTRIVLAARDLLAREGAGGLRARALAQHAGIATGSIYKFYPDMDALIGAVNLQTYHELTAYLGREMTGYNELSCFERLMRLARVYLDYVGTHGALWSALLDYNRGQKSRHDAFIEAEDALFALIEQELASLPKLKPQDCPALARALWASVHGIVAQTLPNSLKPDPVSDTLMQIEMIIGAVVRDYS